MTTQHRPQPSSASRQRNLRWLSRPSRTSSPIRSSSSSPSDNVSVPTTTWIGVLLQRAQMGAAANEAFTPAKHVFQSVVFLLQDVEKMEDNQEVLKDLCKKILSALENLQHVIENHPNDANTSQLREKCQDFQQLLVGMSGKVEEIKTVKSTGHLKFKPFVIPSGIASVMASYEKWIIEFQEELKLLAIANTTHAQITQSHKVVFSASKWSKVVCRHLQP
ncbi:hypothetical protein C8F01DRAFT_160613 [Mycena amicta]|nr:hypothetical protein C8F01DRAFT_160613 [Mycena amicta]